MKEFVSNHEYRATVDDNGTLTVRRGPRTLKRTQWSGGKETVELLTAENAQDKIDRDLIQAMDRMPIFVATWAGNRRWNVDIDCGFQRFNGVKPHRHLVKALQNCFFEPDDIKKMIALCKAAPTQKYCPIQG